MITYAYFLERIIAQLPNLKFNIYIIIKISYFIVKWWNAKKFMSFKHFIAVIAPLYHCFSSLYY